MLKVKEVIMTKKGKHRLTLGQPVTYQIKVQGMLDENWPEWAGEMMVTVQSSGDGLPITILTGALDQAALLGLLRRLYSLGIPLISVVCLDFG